MLHTMSGASIISVEIPVSYQIVYALPELSITRDHNIHNNGMSGVFMISEYRTIETTGNL